MFSIGFHLYNRWFSSASLQVWAYHPSRTASTPPASEWNVPHDGPIDNSFSVAMRFLEAKGDDGSSGS